jgi:hypothetical protein
MVSSFGEGSEAAQQFGLHVAHFLDQPIFHRDQVLLEVLLELLLEKVQVLLGGGAVVVGHR